MRPARRRVLLAATPAIAVLAVLAVVLPSRREAAPPVTPAPTVPAPERQLNMAIGHGLRVELELDRGAVLLGDRVNAVVTLTNETTEPMRILGTHGCDLSVNLRPGQPKGEPQTGIAAEFKERALARSPLAFSFVSDENPLDSCTVNDSRDHRAISPGRPVHIRLWWQAQTPFDFGYDGMGVVTARFYVIDPSQPRDLPLSPPVDLVTTSLPLLVRGAGHGGISPAVAVDAALTDPRFRAFLDAHPPSSWEPKVPRPASVTTGKWYVDDAGLVVDHAAVWWVILEPKARASRDPTVYVDARTGAILGRRLPR